MTPEERLAMAKTAPKVAGPWRGSGGYIERVDAQGRVAFVRECSQGWAASVPGVELLVGYSLGVDGAKRAADEVLLAAGYVLDEGAER
jgi:hypothetical protein